MKSIDANLDICDDFKAGNEGFNDPGRRGPNSGRSSITVGLESKKTQEMSFTVFNRFDRV